VANMPDFGFRGIQDASAPFDGDVIRSIYKKDLNNGVGASGNRLMILELTGFLEKYLLPNFDATTASFEHVMCIILVRAWIVTA
jgi:intron-binding protein aquarius